MDVINEFNVLFETKGKWNISSRRGSYSHEGANIVRASVLLNSVTTYAQFVQRARDSMGNPAERVVCTKYMREVRKNVFVPVNIRNPVDMAGFIAFALGRPPNMATEVFVQSIPLSAQASSQAPP
ncbi:hypothetical protein L1987_76577 [Smallanthus sonchifolius]|uniref:Uncharacterized protein n=1 Tax=Smallanthus sonchifolius TaxID=185202 RepID=A0ACB8Z6P8_9ASTR|nr:hypothetical protein L1987_76577 [Smallanthus sonchifolius]